MNWFKKAQIQDYPLSLAGVRQLYEDTKGASQVLPGQLSLYDEDFLYPGIDRKKIQAILNAFYGLIRSAIENASDFSDFDPQELYDREIIKERVEDFIYFGGYLEIAKKEYLNSLIAERSNEVKEMIENLLNDLFDKKNLDLLGIKEIQEERSNNKEALETLLEKMKKIADHFNLDLTKSEQYEEIYQRMKDNEDIDHLNIYDLRLIVEIIFEEFIEIALDNLEDWENSYGVTRQKIEPEIKDLYNETIKYVDEEDAVKFYTEENWFSLAQQEYESLQEEMLSEAINIDSNLKSEVNLDIPKSTPQNLYQRYSEGPLSYLASLQNQSISDLIEEFSVEAFSNKDFMALAQLTLEDWLKITQTANTELPHNFSDLIHAIETHASFIETIIKSDDKLKQIFEECIDETKYSISPDKMENYYEENENIFSFYAENLSTEELQEEYRKKVQQQIEERRRRLREEEERQRQERLKNDLELAKAEELREKLREDIPTKQQIGEEEAKKMKELGLADKPFEYEYEVNFDKFPGVSAFEDFTEKKKYIPFNISVYVKQMEQIPDNVYEQMILHNVSKSPSKGYAPAVGWIGGFIDSQTKEIYIAEAQSDMMQRTFRMRDPEKAMQQLKEENDKLKQMIEKLETKLTSNPLEYKINGLKDKLDRTDPSHPAYTKMQQALQQMQQQLESGEGGLSQQEQQEIQDKMRIYEQEIMKNKNRIEEYSTSSSTHYDAPIPSLHEYKSVVENTLKNWIEAFFNAAMRYAQAVNAPRIFIITPHSLMDRWKQFAEKSSVQVFEKIYDKMAQFYGAKKLDKNWYVINQSDLKGKVAMRNWYRKVKYASFDPNFWKIHLQKFMEKFLQMMGDETMLEMGYGKESIIQEAFNHWLDEVPSELKDESGNLIPGFRAKVSDFMEQNYDYDPYEGQMDIPDADELAEWWGS